MRLIIDGKICSTCKEFKLLSEFYTNIKNKSGLHSRCKQCWDLDCKKRRELNKKEKVKKVPYSIRFKEEIKEYQQEYRVTNKEKLTIYRKSYRHSEGGKAKRVEEGKKSKGRNPEKHKARNAVQIALCNGTLTKGSCEICDNPNTEGHHWSYAEEDRLHVNWLCHHHHHSQRHKWLRELGIVII